MGESYFVPTVFESLGGSNAIAVLIKRSAADHSKTSFFSGSLGSMFYITSFVIDRAWRILL